MPTGRTALEAVLRTPKVWRGQNCAAIPGHATGYAELDAILPGNGWPIGALTEIYVERPGIGELQLLMPAAARLTQQTRWLALIAPPYIPYVSALMTCGVHLQHVLLLRPQTSDEQSWACEQLLRSGQCGVVLLWLDQVQDRILRRLQHATENGNAMTILYRSHRASPFPAVALRLHINKESSGHTAVHILKNRGGGTVQTVKLDLQGFSAEATPSSTPVRAPTKPQQLQIAH